MMVLLVTWSIVLVMVFAFLLVKTGEIVLSYYILIIDLNDWHTRLFAT